MIVERCVVSANQARRAVAEGAARLELCRELEYDGLTADRDVFLAVAKQQQVPVRVMLRESHPGFGLTPAELAKMCNDARWFAEHGAAGFVFGFAVDGEILIDDCRLLLEACAPLPCTFHKAFDSCDDLPKSLELLVQLGFSAVLTSGGKKTALEGCEVLGELQLQAGKRIEVIVAGKVRPNNIVFLQDKTKANSFHFRI
ncbi:MAG: hypothetical protein H8E25_10105 [Planctomycetes bacterium]|nr:hypothetical protein [Planctomycetota bacterium]